MFQTSPHVYRDNFHKELRALMKDLIKVFPTDREIKMISSSITIAIMDDPEDKIISEFYKAMHPCVAYIANKDEKLFTDNVIKSDIALFSHLEDYWAKLAIENKEVVWAYLAVLYELSKTFYVQNN
jgi:hypothetical protein